MMATWGHTQGESHTIIRICKQYLQSAKGEFFFLSKFYLRDRNIFWQKKSLKTQFSLNVIYQKNWDVPLWGENCSSRVAHVLVHPLQRLFLTVMRLAHIFSYHIRPHPRKTRSLEAADKCALPPASLSTTVNRTAVWVRQLDGYRDDLCPAVLPSGLNLPREHHFPRVLQHTILLSGLSSPSEARQPVQSWRHHEGEIRMPVEFGCERLRYKLYFRCHFYLYQVLRILNWSWKSHLIPVSIVFH